MRWKSRQVDSNGWVDPFDIQIMNKPESEDEEALGINE